VNLNTFGGSKKQGITSRVGLDNWANLAVQTYSNGYGRNKLFYLNQLGGVGAGQSMFNGRFSQKDGVHVNDSIEEDIDRLKKLLQVYYVNPTDPYELALVGDIESFKGDLLAAGQTLEFATQMHDQMIHFDNAYVFSSMPDEMIRLIKHLNRLVMRDISYSILYGTHTLTLVPKKTGIILQNALFGLSKWHGLRIYTRYGPIQSLNILLKKANLQTDDDSFQLSLVAASPAYAAQIANLEIIRFDNSYVFEPNTPNLSMITTLIERINTYAKTSPPGYPGTFFISLVKRSIFKSLKHGISWRAANGIPVFLTP